MFSYGLKCFAVGNREIRMQCAYANLRVQNYAFLLIRPSFSLFFCFPLLNKKQQTHANVVCCLCCGGPTRTGDLQVMSLASYQLLHSAIIILKSDAKLRLLCETSKFLSVKSVINLHRCRYMLYVYSKNEGYSRRLWSKGRILAGTIVLMSSPRDSRWRIVVLLMA